MRAFLFPGQGSQAVGMGRALADASPVAREVFQEVDEAIGQNLFKLMTEGPDDELTLTENAQPAIMANAIATLRVLEREGGVRISEKAQFVAGHSLGEYTALCASGGIALPLAARLLKIRGRAMQNAVPVGIGGMAALLGATLEQAQAIAEAAAQGEVCTVANDNAAGQVVISGHIGAIERAVAMAKDMGAKRGMMLAVSAPFHCSLMQPAADVMLHALKAARIDTPLVALFANVLAAPITVPDEIRARLVDQVTGVVRWRETMLAMQAAGVEDYVEFGAKVLGPMAKRTVEDANTMSIVTMADIEALAKAI
ncbi:MULTISPECIES: ACP S-malonyltransferase [unclassified Sphingomonas]|uniref:ACP S-malonyltransferase n=1 Tax=unclassified Sphingomonas TaxID=196159 RepID=UPI000BD3FB9E|nr:MAG: [acyl-carrier-protein] S-malonyltransferase [Sphingomonas sp. 12-62-6]OYX39041.1 MAG: [acyl-carrier-protein] S-malonyltransferase [Sphingomonas sp. 32-62-10]